MTNKLMEFFKRNFKERKQAKQRTTTYVDAVKKIKVLQIEKKCVANELISISDFMKTTEQMLGIKNV